MEKKKELEIKIEAVCFCFHSEIKHSTVLQFFFFY
jgi:hypothetical protein